MAHALNLTLALKQDPQSQATLSQVKATFAKSIQPAVDAALALVGWAGRVMTQQPLFLPSVSK